MDGEAFERALINVRDRLDRQIEALEADLRRRPPHKDKDPRPGRLARMRTGRERCEQVILRKYENEKT